MDKPRNFYINTYHHLYNRGAFQQPIFIENNDYDYFIRKVIEYKTKFSIEILCYCLMPNHFHLFAKQTSEDKNISQFISGLSNSFTKGMNIKYNHSGVLFAGKTKSKQIKDDSYFKWVIKYILENPVKALIVKSYNEYDYSSAKELVGLKEETATDVKLLLSYFDSIELFKNFMLDENQKSDFEI